MALEMTEAAAKLQLDEMTGEMVSKNELAKRTKKRARKASKLEAAALVKDSTNDHPAKSPTTSSSPPGLDADAMFKQGFLAEVYKERPAKEVVTRFPPEPNGYLHLGHAKAIAVNFGFARYHGGRTILRFDDTNPSKEEEKYFLAIENTIKWLGFGPSAVTYSSDNFQRLYELAEKLITLDKAYVCHCDAAQVRKQRGGKDGKEGPRYRCLHAEQGPALNLQKFRDMRDGKYKYQGAFLRMKQDIESGNPQMWDLAAYRIPPEGKAYHYRTKDAWKIYPTYDFAHCLCDSLEGVTHSLCTTEFILSRESYEWLNHTLGVPHEPMQREFGRLSVAGTVTSKRALLELVEKNVVRGWDDPRLYTLAALRRRGVPPGAILAFINGLGVTTARTTIEIARFDQSIRSFLETTVPRLMLVLHPIPVVIEGADATLADSQIDVPFSPKNPGMGSRKLTICRRVYIDRSDFREVDDPNFFRLAPGKTVGLLHFPGPITATGFTKDDSGKVVEIQAIFKNDETLSKPKSFIHWVSDGSRTAEVRIHGRSFHSDEPILVEGGIMQDLSLDSETVYPNAMIEDGFNEVRRRAPWPREAGETARENGGLAPETVRFQGMRVAYFAMDTVSTDDHIVLNRIVSLKEDPAKS